MPSFKDGLINESNGKPFWVILATYTLFSYYISQRNPVQHFQSLGLSVSFGFTLEEIQGFFDTYEDCFEETLQGAVGSALDFILDSVSPRVVAMVTMAVPNLEVEFLQ